METPSELQLYFVQVLKNDFHYAKNCNKKAASLKSTKKISENNFPRFTTLTFTS